MGVRSKLSKSSISGMDQTIATSRLKAVLLISNVTLLAFAPMVIFENVFEVRS
jgi:hypothetical protein